MTEEEAKQLEKQLKERGVELGQWFDVKGGVLRHQALEDQKQMLLQMRGLLEGQLAVHLKQLDDAVQQLERTKHGGGQ